MKLPQLNVFRTPSAMEIAQRDLEEAKRALLDQQATAEHAAKMVEYYQGVVTRLSNYVQQDIPLTRPQEWA